MRVACITALLAVSLAVAVRVHAQVSAADIRVIAPGVVYLASLAFIRYITRPEANAVWNAKGLSRL